MPAQPAISNSGLRHLALNVTDVGVAVEFYTSLFGMQIVWQPDPDNAYLSSGCDNLALHRAADGIVHDGIVQHGQRLDHFGIIVPRPEDVDQAAATLETRRVPVVKPPRTHRDGSRSLYCTDPDGNLIQILYEPTLSPQRLT